MEERGEISSLALIVLFSLPSTSRAISSSFVTCRLKRRDLLQVRGSCEVEDSLPKSAIDLVETNMISKDKKIICGCAYLILQNSQERALPFLPRISSSHEGIGTIYSTLDLPL